MAKLSKVQGFEGVWEVLPDSKPTGKQDRKLLAFMMRGWVYERLQGIAQGEADATRLERELAVAELERRSNRKNVDYTPRV